MNTNDVAVRSEPLDSPVARELIEELNAELLVQYPEPGATFFSLPVADEFVVGWRVADGDDVPLGCGALRVIADGVGELKRMYVRPAARGTGVGSAILAGLETAAHDRGLHRLVLETGVRQAAAMTLYTRHGFGEVACWGAYATSPLSVCLAKQLH